MNSIEEEGRELDKRTLIILARDFLREASENQDDPLYEIVHQLELFIKTIKKES